MRLSMDIVPAIWSNNYAGHRQWCITQTQETANFHREARRTALQNWKNQLNRQQSDNRSKYRQHKEGITTQYVTALLAIVASIIIALIGLLVSRRSKHKKNLTERESQAIKSTSSNNSSNGKQQIIIVNQTKSYPLLAFIICAPSSFGLSLYLHSNPKLINSIQQFVNITTNYNGLFVVATSMVTFILCLWIGIMLRSLSSALLGGVVGMGVLLFLSGILHI